jgi:uncharacterized membrane protein YkvA (DUF1232 family)
MSRVGRTTAFVALVRALRGAGKNGSAGVGERLRAVPRLVRATLAGRYRGTTRGQLGLIALAVLYTLSPIDLVPEAFIPLLGLADDALVVSWIAGRLLAETEAFLSWERAEPSRSREDVVEGHVVR